MVIKVKVKVINHHAIPEGRPINSSGSNSVGIGLGPERPFVTGEKTFTLALGSSNPGVFSFQLESDPDRLAPF